MEVQERSNMLSYDEFRAAWLGSDDAENKKRNKALVERYPFLLPRHEWSQEPLEDYDYEFTNLDDMPRGWKKAFGVQMCEELRDILIEGNYLDKYQVVQVKEKYGRLCWYDDNGVPDSVWDKYRDWLSKYEDLSERTCIICGEPGHVMKTGWICPYCKDCFAKQWPNRDYEEWRAFK